MAETGTEVRLRLFTVIQKIAQVFQAHLTNAVILEMRRF
jgi:hypothetical protein